MLTLLAAALLAAAPPPPGPAEAPDAERKQLEEQIARELGAPATGPAPGDPPAAQGQGTAAQGARLLLLPDIAAIGSAALAYHSLDVRKESPRGGELVSEPGKVTPIFQELELSLQAVVDPYARADVFISLTRDGAGVEEAYLTTLALPWGLQVRAGTLKSPFGRLNQQHPHVWDFADAPLALSRLVAADSLNGPGADLAWLAPLPWFAELHLAWQRTIPGFEAEGRRTGVGRLIQYFDLSEAVALGMGLSGALLKEPGPGAWRDLGAADLYLKMRPPRGRAYVALQGELFARRLAGTASDGTDWGGYAQLLWRPSAYAAVGARYDNAPAQGGVETRWSALGTWLPSEFMRLRLQLAYDRLPQGRDGLEALLHLEFAIGSHGAHPF